MSALPGSVALIVAVTVPTAIDLLWVLREPQSLVPMTILTAFVAIPLVWRSQAPAIAFWVIAVLTGIGLIALSSVGFSSSIMSCLPMAAAAFQLALIGRPTSPLRFALALVALFAIDIVVLYQVTPVSSRGWEGSALALFLVLFALTAGLATRQRLDAAHDRAQLESERARFAAHDERERIARDLHDGLAHHLTALVLRAEASRARLARRPVGAADESTDSDIPDVGADLSAISESGRRAVREITVILDVLRGTRPAPGIDQLDELVATARSAGAGIIFLRSGPTPPATVGAVAYRVIQEALNNAIRHGARGEIEIDVEQAMEGITITVSNPVDGVASVPPEVRGGSGLGITGIRERVAELGGEVRVDRSSDRFTLHTRIPAGS